MHSVKNLGTEERRCSLVRDSGVPAWFRSAARDTDDTEWASTYQAVPTELDAALAQHGATRIHPRGAGDVRGDFCVCGTANTMAPGIRIALIQVLRMHSGAAIDGNNWLAGLRADGRFLEDIWGG
jgi:cytochrome P450 / NADPH-cytochrome P450 reductase